MEDRLSRIERSLEAVAEQQAQFAFQLIDSAAEFDRRMEESRERFDRGMEESRERFDRAMQEGNERHNREMGEIRKELREVRHELNRAVRASVEEARRERVRRKELDEKITQLASAQLLTEQKMAELAVTLQAFLKRSGNRNIGKDT